VGGVAIKEGASSLTEYFHAMLANTRWNEFGTILLIAASYATLVAILLVTIINRLSDYSPHTEQVALVTWVVLFSLMRYRLIASWKAYSQQLIDLAHKNVFERGLLLEYVWDVLERHESRAQARHPSEQLTRPLHAQVPIRLINVLARFVRDYAKLCDERGLAIIVDTSTRAKLRWMGLLGFYLALTMHIGWLVLEVNAAHGLYAAVAIALLAVFLSIIAGSHQTLQHLMLDVIVRRALLREFLGV